MVLTSDEIHHSPCVWKEIAEGKYRCIFCGPEMTLARNGPLRSLLSTHQGFHERLMYVAFDEIHYMLSWKKRVPARIWQLALYSTSAGGCKRKRAPICALKSAPDEAKFVTRSLDIRESSAIIIDLPLDRPNFSFGAKISVGAAVILR